MLHFNARQAGRKLVFGYFKVVTYSSRSRFIYEGSDAFVNYCIDSGQKIESSGGKLYCWYPGYHHTYVTSLHWSRGTHR